MKAEFPVSVVVEETICCATCDHRGKRCHTEKRGLLERLLSDGAPFSFSDKTKKVYGADYCELLDKDISNVAGEDVADMPCGREQWQTTEDYYEIGFLVKFKDRLQSNSKD